MSTQGEVTTTGSQPIPRTENGSLISVSDMRRRLVLGRHRIALASRKTQKDLNRGLGEILKAKRF